MYVTVTRRGRNFYHANLAFFLYCAIHVTGSDTSEQNDMKTNIKKVNGVVKKSDIER